MKKIIIIAIICIISIAFARPVFYHRPMHGQRIYHMPPPPPPHHYYHHSHHSAFWTGVGVGFVGSLLAPTPAPVVVSPARVWVPPVYGERPIYHAGIYVGMERYVITPGYYK